MGKGALRALLASRSLTRAQKARLVAAVIRKAIAR